MEANASEGDKRVKQLSLAMAALQKENLSLS
jgi:hypothetical protein